MKSKLFWLPLFVLCFAVFSSQSLHAAFSNNGRMQSRCLNIRIGGTLDNNGELIGTETARISCSTLTGKGLIRAPVIVIKTKTFAFTGTIDCSERCVIVASHPVDETTFTKAGTGEFVYVVDEDGLMPQPLPVPLPPEKSCQTLEELIFCEDELLIHG